MIKLLSYQLYFAAVVEADIVWTGEPIPHKEDSLRPLHIRGIVHMSEDIVLVLSYYSYISTGGTASIQNYIASK